MVFEEMLLQQKGAGGGAGGGIGGGAGGGGGGGSVEAERKALEAPWSWMTAAYTVVVCFNPNDV